MDDYIRACVIRDLGLSRSDVELAIAAHTNFMNRSIAARNEDTEIQEETLSEAIDPLSYTQCVLFGVIMADNLADAKMPIPEEAP